MEKPKTTKEMGGKREVEHEPQIQQSFFYPGGGEFNPITVHAKSQEEADEKYAEVRTKPGQE